MTANREREIQTAVILPVCTGAGDDTEENVVFQL